MKARHIIQKVYSYAWNHRLYCHVEYGNVVQKLVFHQTSNNKMDKTFKNPITNVIIRHLKHAIEEMLSPNVSLKAWIFSRHK